MAFDIDVIKRDMAAKGWNNKDLALAAKCSEMSVSRFLRGRQQTNRLLKRLASALGRQPGCYLLTARKDA